MLTSHLQTLGFDSQDTKIYLTLLETGSIPAGKLAKTLGVPRSSVYGYLKKLTDGGLITESQKRGTKFFSAENPEKVNQLFTEQIEKLQKNQESYKTLLPELRSKRGQKLLTPRLQLFEGADGLRQVLKDMLLYYDLETQALWPIQRMLEVLGPDFFRYLNKERIKNRLYTRAIWPADQVADISKHPYLGSGKAFQREVRIAPKEFNFSMGYWIYGNKVAFISSRKESIGFIIESAEFKETLRIQFEVMWKLSKPLITKPEDAAAFLKELE